ncbi:uncharacterized protein UDID_07917 [Ustilago sp. UG-2017a]|nr:uncharacterized protein UDID_07917 [Ustilago sp. UG-2017a]
MDRLQPAMYGASAMRSFSAESYGSDGSASSSHTAQDAVHTPSTSPSLSDRGASSSDSAKWATSPHAHQLSSPDPAAGSGQQGLSPLELLVKRGKQVQHEILEPIADSTHDAANHPIFERASALSRKTSVRKPPIQPSPDPDDFDDTRSIRSVNLLSEDGSSFSRSARGSAPSSASIPPNPQSSNSSFSVQRGYKASYDDSSDSYLPTETDNSWQRQSSHLLSNAFRSSIASDISFNSITGDALDSSLSRRASIDTVRSSEFGEDGRWGRAWANRADDEESAYAESTYGDIYDDHNDGGLNGDRSSLMNYSIDLDPSRGPLASHGGLSSVAKQWKLDQASSSALSRCSPNSSSSSSGPAPAIREVQSKEKIVSLTRSAPPPTSTTTAHLQQPSLSYGHADPRHSYVPQIETQDYDAEHAQQLSDRTPMASADRYLGHRNTSSTSTITGSNTNSPPTARVYVYPPSPSGSEASRVSGGEHCNSMPNRTGQQRYASMPHATSAQIETVESSPQDNAQRTPLAPSSLLSNPRSASAGALGSHQPRSSGHPAGRAPPPPPPPGAGTPGSELGYSDPNQYFHGIDRPIIGRNRAEAIKRADGRESMVSDLDVETLRLDGSSRRDSTSTIGSVMTSRMSVGSVHHSPLALQSNASWQDQSVPNVPQAASPRSQQQPSIQAKASQASFRSLQPVQGTVSNSNFGTQGTPTTSRPPMLRNAKSSNALPSTTTGAGSVGMQPTASSPPVGLGLNPNPSIPKPRPSASPAVDTCTGPTSAEDFLSQGITYHEQGDLARSAFYFERSAKVDGGCVVGMCMFGMALREGWGARKDPVKGFSWIQRAAARAGEMMANTTTPKTESELKAIKSELKLSVYELGKCWCYGWGVKMDKHMALEYFELAAKLGDADAQAEAGALFAAGKGCKKDLKKAAMYYRMAEEGGYDTVGLSWIHKDKYK